LPSTNGKLFVAGFCWGGGKSFAFATHRHDLSAAFVFYGPPPPDFSTITAPVYGFYAGDDARISATVPATIEAMKAAGKKYEPVIYDGAGHGFMRAGQAPGASDGNKKAYEEGFARLTSLIDTLNAAATARLQKPAHTTSSRAQVAAAAMSCHDTAKSSDAKHDAGMDMAAIM
jgi:carboxymethylenebutenolidase